MRDQKRFVKPLHITAIEKIFGPELVEPAIFFIGLQPHTHRQYGFEQGLIQPGYNPMSMMPWTARAPLESEPMEARLVASALKHLTVIPIASAKR